MTSVTKAKKMDQEDLKYFKELILKRREETLKDIRRLESLVGGDESSNENVSMDSAYSYHMADIGTDAQEREKTFLWLSRENKFLTHLNAALDRIQRGEYGICIECGELIPKERLEEVPHTQHCAKCKNKLK
jgi:RNA polymerase-binding protein DksA